MLRDEIIEKVSKDLGISEEITDLVISWSYKKANEATKTNNEVEFSGFGKILVSKTKIARRLKRLEIILEATKNREDSENKEKRLKSINSKIEYLKSKYE